MVKVKMMKRNPLDYVRETKDDIHKLPRNYDPAAHPFEAAREYQRAVNAVKLDRVFAKPFLGNLCGHGDGVSSLALHPSRLSLLASTSCDGELRLWDLATRKCLVKCTGHNGSYARDACFTPDSGSRLFSVGDDKQIRIWNTDDIVEEESEPRKPVDSILTKGMLTGISHHRQDSSFATCGEATILWDSEVQSPINEYQWGVDSIHCVKFNQVEPNVLGACASDRSVILYDIREARPMRKVVMNLKTNSIAWNPMEAFVFVGANEDYNLYAFDIRNLKRPLNVHMDHTAAVISVDFAPTGREFVSGSYDKTVRIYQTDQGHSREIYHTKRMQRLTCVSWTKDNRYILTGSDEMNIRLWKARASEKLGVLKERERSALEYGEKLKEKYGAHPQVKKILKRRHVPKHVMNAQDEHRIIKDSKGKKEANRRKHSKPGAVPYLPEREKHVVKEQE